MSPNTLEEMTDSERLDWLQAKHTLHGAVEFLYVVDGYELTLTYDGNSVLMLASRPTIRDAIDAAIEATRNDRP